MAASLAGAGCPPLPRAPLWHFADHLYNNVSRRNATHSSMADRMKAAQLISMAAIVSHLSCRQLLTRARGAFSSSAPLWLWLVFLKMQLKSAVIWWPDEYVLAIATWQSYCHQLLLKVVRPCAHNYKCSICCPARSTGLQIQATMEVFNAGQSRWQHSR